MAEQIEAIGARAWIDEKDLEGGDIVLAKLVSAIGASNEMIVLVSPAVRGSDWVKVEIGMALGQGKRVTPFLSHVEHDTIAPIASVTALDLNSFGRYVGGLRSRVTNGGANISG